MRAPARATKKKRARALLLRLPPPTPTPETNKQTYKSVRDTWTELNSGVYVATIAFAYLCFIMLLLFFFALVVFQSAVTAELAALPAAALPGGGGSPFAAPAALRNPFAAHQAKYEVAYPYAGGGGMGSPPPPYDSPHGGGARIPAVRAGGMQASASPAGMAKPTPMAGMSPLAMQQDSAI